MNTGRGSLEAAYRFGLPLLLAASQAVAGVLPLEGYAGYDQRPLTQSQPGIYGTEPRYTALPLAGGERVWVLDRQSGRLRVCEPASSVEQPPRCSPWSE
ncbi:MAG TPA: hypothetical protein VIW02_09220 [Gammaproteobacteria bacterium]